eukprot:3420791-Rhodomonas_salina.2
MSMIEPVHHVAICLLPLLMDIDCNVSRRAQKSTDTFDIRTPWKVVRGRQKKRERWWIMADVRAAAPCP